MKMRKMFFIVYLNLFIELNYIRASLKTSMVLLLLIGEGRDEVIKRRFLEMPISLKQLF
jgi:hypothetical protein